MEPYLDNPILLFLDRYLIIFVTYICAFMIYCRGKGIILTKRQLVSNICLLVILPFVFQLFGGNNAIFVKICYIVLMCCVFSIIDKENLHANFICAIISISIAYCIEYISVLISGTILFLFGYRELNIFTTLLACFVQTGLCFGISKLKRIKNSFTYLSNESNFGIGLIVSSWILVFSLAISLDNWTQNSLVLIVLFGVPLALAGLILWIRSIVKRFYKNMLQDRMDEYTKHELEDKDKRIERLEAEVASLAKQVHRDNHLMASVDRSMQSLAECDSAEQREQIIGEIHTLYLERNDSIAKEQQKNKILPSTGISLIDSSLSELYVKAAARGISFDLSVSEELHYLVNNIISQTDLQTLICDHVKDAIIAVEVSGTTNGRILVTIEKNDSIFEISIRDSGIDFEADTLAKIGKEQVTTHADSGGSGIGFMTTFETLRKTKGSLIITEYEQKTPFSKSVTFVFDGLNRFIISTYRKEELEKIIDRDDLLII